MAAVQSPPRSRHLIKKVPWLIIILSLLSCNILFSKGEFYVKKEIKKIAKVILGMFMVVFIGMQITSGVKAATEDETPTEIYYKGYNITYGGEKGILHTKNMVYRYIF